eukprot:TRINITY_DN11446_c0_g1_i1.p1 TRINITY_DN11446_c0_g1~~TRINITY_DN11446_c0_g1_i1.p1  ORF type:complete len:355 (-),score=55.19 TRINITY_DN11446_c0_g1_i1:12-1076(-)
MNLDNPGRKFVSGSLSKSFLLIGLAQLLSSAFATLCAFEVLPWPRAVNSLIAWTSFAMWLAFGLFLWSETRTTEFPQQDEVQKLVASSSSQARRRIMTPVLCIALLIALVAPWAGLVVAAFPLGVSIPSQTCRPGALLSTQTIASPCIQNQLSVVCSDLPSGVQVRVISHGDALQMGGFAPTMAAAENSTACVNTNQEQEGNGTGVMMVCEARCVVSCTPRTQGGVMSNCAPSVFAITVSNAVEGDICTTNAAHTIQAMEQQEPLVLMVAIVVIDVTVACMLTAAAFLRVWHTLAFPALFSLLALVSVSLPLQIGLLSNWDVVPIAHYALIVSPGCVIAVTWIVLLVMRCRRLY